MQRMTVQQYRQRVAKQRSRSKYGNKKTIVNGITFDSEMEARYYQQLVCLKQGKAIKDFKLQPRFVLLDAFEKDGVKYRKIEYVADFEVHNLDGTIEIIDVKGKETKEFLIKKKLFHARYDHKLSIVTCDPTYGWIELDELKKYKKPKRRSKR